MSITKYLHCKLHIILVWSQGRRGHYIKTNSGGIKRRLLGITRGTKMAPQGRPAKRKLGAQNLPFQAKKSIKPHSLSKNIYLVHVDVNIH